MLEVANAWLTSQPRLCAAAREGYLAILAARLSALDIDAPEAERLRSAAFLRWQRLGDRLVHDLKRDAGHICGNATASVEELASDGTALRLLVGGRAVHYKLATHPVAPALQALVSGLPLPTPLHVRRMVVGDGCLWDETIEPAPCQSFAEVTRYYHRLGEWLGIAAALGVTDLHARNLCAHGEYPVPFDVEAIGEGPISPLAVGLLPAWLDVPPGVISPQVGGLHAGGELCIDGTSYRVTSTWPMLDGVRIAPRTHIDTVLAGLTAAVEVMTTERLATWRAVARVPLRPPRAYRAIMRESLSADCLVNTAERRARITTLVTQLVEAPEDGEIESLLELEVPMVERRYRARPPMIPGSSDRSVIRTLLELGSNERPSPSVEASVPPNVLDPITLGDLVLSAAELRGDRLDWVGAMWLPLAGVRRFAHAPMDLLSGQAGFAIVFAALHRTSGEVRFRDASRACIRGVVASLAEDSPSCGAFAGLGGRLFALRTCSVLLDEPTLAHLADKRFAAIDLPRLAAVASTDPIVGLPGLLLAHPDNELLASLVAATPARALLPGLGGVPPALREGRDPVVELTSPPALEAPLADGIPLRHSPCALTGALSLAYRSLRTMLPGMCPSLVTLR